MVKLNKDKIKEKVIKNGKEQYLSAQEYGKMTSNEKRFIRESLEEEGKDADDYEGKMKKLWPKVFQPKPLQWRVR